MKKIIYNALYWFIVQMIIAQLGTRISYKFLEKDNKYFRSWNFEKEGQLWQQLVKVQYWKDHLPDGQHINSDIKSKSTFDLSKNVNEIQQFILETRRAEIVHMLSIFSVIAFYKSSKSVKIINFAYVVIANVPCMIVQRYNRPKLIRIYNKLLKRKGD
ncbi:glycosyl-4,4'-diaponeurosporenoate acyltransferase CrtO family protein [Mammaliicoccus fleurettii]|uniref:glycosyl-4,4'-diaponeurosporenoate acyltransferase CrtO family protein n=1 Tax=Mammaliicoccus fleurettii TaxID=150056 RepID=UPI0009926E92|nr:glycosyl-4,4'-diaponeurosporenoate acyltransferase [Mammaliicoccus fleurettii]MEB7725233.1 glycosyl-4,4'-diaponeurosporenoate acyltransferase [Mammaliicoccus fleurettii]MEB8067406.1 glycosyl-4,4'-diaponeurosporenoate acyltransferase [Mammaliicoccus fleurettii]OOV77527.1 glycosyl-4,4'-diaponeurosporenoate acyltransferase [Mammaliicoccus fleurettii]